VSLESPPLDLVVRYNGFYQWLVPRLNVMIELFPDAVPTSWFRSEADNLRVGGAPFSQHLLAWAVDWDLPRDQHRDLVLLAMQLGMVAVDEGDHVHVQMYPAGRIPKSFFLPAIHVAV